MTSQQTSVCTKLKQMGYAKGNQIRIYGQQFELVSDPITVRDELVFVDGVESRSGETRRVRIPLPVVRMVSRDLRAA